MEAPISTQATHNRRQKAAVPLCTASVGADLGLPSSRGSPGSRAAVLAPPSRERKIFGVEKGRPRSPPTEVVCEAGTMGWLTGRGRGGGRRAHCHRASRASVGRQRPSACSTRPRSASSSKATRTEPPSVSKAAAANRVPPPVSVPSMTAAARATRSSETPRAMRHAQHEVFGSHLPRVQVIHHLSVLHPHATLGVLGHGDGRAPQPQVGLAVQ